MKKYLLGVVFSIATSSFAQTITTKNENASVAQYELLQKVNQYYPDISLNDKVTNFYSDEKIIDSKQEFNLEGSKFSSYKISIAQDNQKLLFEFISEINGKIYGNVTKFKGKYIRTTFTENKSEVQVSVDGKAVYKKKI